MSLLYGAIIAFSMYSVLPMPRVEWSKSNMRYAMCFFPLVGAAVGGAVWLWLWLAQGLSAGLTAALATALPVLISGGIHLDGFCDTSDALASHAPVEKKLEILKDSNVGAFALIGCVLCLLLFFGLWTQFQFSPRAAGTVALGYIFSRCLSGLSVVSFRCAKNSGLAYTFADGAARKRAGLVLGAQAVLTASGMLLLSPTTGVCCLAAGGLAFGCYRWTSYRNFGGITGDLAGYFLELCELMMLAGAVIAGEIA